jgi:hypothetical protein
MHWTPNPGGQRRTIEEAIEIAKRHGAEIADDVALFEDEWGTLGPETTAAGSRISKKAGDYVQLSDFVHPVTQKVPFIIRPDVLESDEAIVAVLTHEMYELNGIHGMIRKGGMTIEDFGLHTSPGLKGNLHDRAWDLADEAVLRMRGQSK